MNWTVIAINENLKWTVKIIFRNVRKINLNATSIPEQYPEKRTMRKLSYIESLNFNKSEHQ